MSWFKKPVNLAITVGAVVLAIVAVGMIIWGVTHHTESGLLQVCWVNGRAQYVEEGPNDACSRPEELRWPAEKVPLTVAVQSPSGYLGEGSASRRSVDAAIRDINGQVGFQLLRSAPVPESASIVVHLGEAVEVETAKIGSAMDIGSRTKRTPGYATHMRGPEVVQGLRAEVHVYSNVGSERLEYLVVHHELLHAVGLAHDSDNPASAIFPLTVDDTELDLMIAARITDSDVRLLQELYRR